MFSKKFISFTVISGVLASSLSQLGFAENGSVGNEEVVGKNENKDLETASNSEDLSLKNEPEEKELVNKSEDNDDNSSENADDLKNEENDDDSVNSDDDDSDGSGDSSLYQWWKEALGNKFEAAKPYFKKAQETLKTYLKKSGDFLGKVANHEAFLPTATAFTTAAGTYKLLEKLNNRNKTNENLTGVQEPEYPQEVVTPSPQQDHNVKEKNKKIDDENNKIEQPSDDFEVKAAEEEGNERHYAFLATMTFIILFFGGISWYLLKKLAAKERNKQFLKFIDYLKECAQRSKDYTATAQGNIMAGNLVKVGALKGGWLYEYLKKYGYIKGDEKEVYVVFSPCFNLDLENFEDVSSPKVHILLTNMFIDGKEVKSNADLSLKRHEDGFKVNLKGVDLTFNLEDDFDYSALSILVGQTIDTIEIGERKNKSQEIERILFKILKEVADIDKLSAISIALKEQEAKQEAKGVIWDEEKLYDVLKGLASEINLLMEDNNSNNYEDNLGEKKEEIVEIISNKKIIANDNDDNIEDSKMEIKRKEKITANDLLSENIKKILKVLRVDAQKYKYGVLSKKDLFDILREEFLKESNGAVQGKLKDSVKNESVDFSFSGNQFINNKNNNKYNYNISHGENRENIYTNDEN